MREKGQRLGCPSSASQWPCTASSDAPTAGRQAIFLGATEPRAARPERRLAARAMLVGQGQLAVSTIVALRAPADTARRCGAGQLPGQYLSAASIIAATPSTRKTALKTA